LFLINPNLPRGIFIVESKTFMSYSSKYLTIKIQSKYAPKKTDPFRHRYTENPILPDGEKSRVLSNRLINGDEKKAKMHAIMGLRYTSLKKDVIVLFICL